MGVSQRLVASLALGMGMCFAWVFVAHPTVDATSALQVAEGYPQGALLRLATVGLVPTLALPPLSPLVTSARAWAAIAAAGLALRLLGSVVVFLARPLGSPFSLLLLGDFLTGAGVAAALVLWGLLVSRRDEDEGELAFVLTFVVAGVFVCVAGLVPSAVTSAATFVLPPAEFACFVCANRLVGTPAGEDGASPVSAQPGPKGLGQTLAGLVGRTCLAITLVSFVWEMFSAATGGTQLPKLALFGVGLVVSSLRKR